MLIILYAKYLQTYLGEYSLDCTKEEKYYNPALRKLVISSEWLCFNISLLKGLQEPVNSQRITSQEKKKIKLLGACIRQDIFFLPLSFREIWSKCIFSSNRCSYIKWWRFRGYHPLSFQWPSNLPWRGSQAKHYQQHTHAHVLGFFLWRNSFLKPYYVYLEYSIYLRM